MDDVLAAYKGIRIRLQPTQLHDGTWKADFTLDEEHGSSTESVPYYGKNAYASRDEAKRAALDSARRIIDTKY